MSINNCVFMGRMVREPEIKRTPSGKSVLSFTIAVDRNGNDVDFIPCNAWEKTAEFISKYFPKGSMIAVSGEMRSRTYNSQNGKRTVIECLVGRTSFTGEKKTSDTQAKNHHYEALNPDEYTPIGGDYAPDLG